MMTLDTDNNAETLCGCCDCREDVCLPAEVKRNLTGLGVSDALEQVGVAVGSSSAVAELPDAGSELHGAPVTHPALRTRGGH